jgi:hypothetical protein
MRRAGYVFQCCLPPACSNRWNIVHRVLAFEEGLQRPNVLEGSQKAAVDKWRIWIPFPVSGAHGIHGVGKHDS